MNKITKRLLFSALLLMMVLSLGCSSGENEDPPATNDEAAHSADCSIFPVNAQSYANSSEIKLFIMDETAGGIFVPVSDGDFVGSDIHTLGVQVSAGDGTPIKHVVLSNGGTKCAEAFLDNSGYYVCDFDFSADEYMAYPILIQVFHTADSASKKKYVLTAGEIYRAADGKLVKQGLGITAGKKVLSGLKGEIEKLFGTALNAEGQVKVNEFRPADNSTGAKNGVFYVDAVLPSQKLLDVVGDEGGNCFLSALTPVLAKVFGDVDIKGDLFLNDTQNGKRALFIGFEDLKSDKIKKMTGIEVSAVAGDVSFPMDPISFDLGEMLGGLGGGGEDDLMATLLGNLNLNKLLFLNVYGLPSDTSPLYAALGAGLFATPKNLVEQGDDGEFMFPVVEEDDTASPMDMGLLKKGGDYTIGIGLSQYNLNQILSEIVDGIKITLDASTLPIDLAIPQKGPGIKQEIAISLNPAGIGVDLTHQMAPPIARLDLMDVKMEYMENGAPMWQMSLDISTELEIGVHSDGAGLFLDLALTPIESFCHAHTIKDNLGITVFDNSRFVMELFNTIAVMGGGATGEPFKVSLPLSDFGLTPSAVGNPGTIDFDGNGNCFMNLAVDSVKAEGLCFISTAGL